MADSTITLFVSYWWAANTLWGFDYCDVVVPTVPQSIRELDNVRREIAAKFPPNYTISLINWRVLSEGDSR